MANMTLTTTRSRLARIRAIKAQIAVIEPYLWNLYGQLGRLVPPKRKLERKGK